jgi:hypothetical protein
MVAPRKTSMDFSRGDRGNNVDDAEDKPRCIEALLPRMAIEIRGEVLKRTDHISKPFVGEFCGDRGSGC